MRTCVFSALTNIADVKHSFFRDAALGERYFQETRRFQNIFPCQHPRPPVYAERLPAPGIGKNVDAVEWIRMHWRHDATRVVGSYRNQAQVERSSEIPYLLEPILFSGISIASSRYKPEHRHRSKGYRRLSAPGLCLGTQIVLWNRNTSLGEYTYAGQCGKLYFSS